MKGNKINALLWFLLALFFLTILIRGLSGRNWRNIKFWTWNNNSTSDWDLDDSVYIQEDSDGDYVTYSYDVEKVNDIEIGVVSSHIKCYTVSDTGKIEIKISDNIDVRKYFDVKLTGTTLSVKRKPKVNNGINIQIGTKIFSDATEVIVLLPETVFNSISLENVSGRTSVKNISARKVNIENVSGKVEAENIQGRTKLHSVSGSIECTLDELKNNLEAGSVSGSLEINLPGKADFEAEYETVSGSVKTDFNKKGKREGTISNGSRTYDLQFETVSGSIKVNSI